MSSDQESEIKARVEALLSQMTLQEKVSLFSGKDLWRTVPVERLGIPSIVMTDGPHGVRASDEGTGRIVGPATSYPTGISMGASWDPDLVAEVGAALGEETREMGCDILLGPCVNIVRSPLGGRNFETYSEDPHLSGRIGVGYVKGVQSKQIGTSLKHYAANNQEFERNRGNSVVDERTLREIYLPAFETIVKEAKPWTVMCSYNRINGVYASQNTHLLREILKGEWGYEGLVVSDWGANHTSNESVQGGLDIEMPGPAKYYGQLLTEAVINWQVDEKLIDEGVRRILRVILLSGRMDDPVRLPPGSGNTPQHQALARRLAEESITLLKNDGGLLPLNQRPLDTIAVIGPNAAEARIGGGGSSYLEPHYRVSPLEAMKSKLGNKIEIAYERGCDNTVTPPIFEGDWLVQPSGKHPGLLAEYFNNADLSGVPAATGTARKLEFFWFGHGPAEGISRDEFSMRLTGKLVPAVSGQYTLVLGNTESCRLYLDGNLLVENNPGHVSIPEMRVDQDAISKTVQVDLQAGKAYDLRLEFSKTPGEMFAALRLNYILPKPTEDPIARAVELARKSDVAVIFAGMPTHFETEGGDRPDMELPGPQVELIRAVAAVNPKTVVVMYAGAPVAMPWLDAVPAVLEAYYPGQEGGNAVMNVLWGDVNPSGKLPVSFPKRLEDNPAYLYYPGQRDVHYGEGIFVGYRYYDTRGVEPLFAFGHGLSYTTFEYHDLKVASGKSGEPVTVSLTVGNTGSYSGKEVVQLYVSDRQSSLPRPVKELKGFKKIALKPGESQTVSFTLDQRAFSFYDPYRAGWVTEPGDFEVLVGSSSRDIRLKAGFTLAP